MADAAPLVDYARSGGRAPADDERLTVGSDGSFTARRTVGAARVGTFAGSLPADDRDALTAGVAACREAGELWLETPRDGATETVTLGGDEAALASLGSNADPGGPWGALVGRLRGLLDRATDEPAGAIELVADATGARLVAAGEGTLGVAPATLAVRVVHLDARGVPAGQWRAGGGEPVEGAAPPAWEDAAPGWTLDLPWDHGLAAGAGEWLQVWVTLRVRDETERLARLFVALPGG